MKDHMKLMGNWVLVLLLTFILSGCSDSHWDEGTKPRISDEELIPGVERVINEELDQVEPFMDDETKCALRDVSQELTGKKVVEEALNEEKGRDYLEFTYDVAYGSDSDLDSFVENSKMLMDDEHAAELDNSIKDIKRGIEAQYAPLGKAIPPSQQEAFNRDVRKLLVKTIVLFVAGIVYSCMPKLMFWGKVSAASAVAVAAGVLSSTILNLYQYYKYGGSVNESFSTWMKECTTEPQLAYAMASTMITMGKTLHRSPVVTGITISVFSLYNVLDIVKGMLKKYSFKS